MLILAAVVAYRPNKPVRNNANNTPGVLGKRSCPTTTSGFSIDGGVLQSHNHALLAHHPTSGMAMANMPQTAELVHDGDHRSVVRLIRGSLGL